MKPKIIDCNGYLEYGKVIDRKHGSVQKELRSIAIENRERYLSGNEIDNLKIIRGKYYIDHGEYFTLELFIVINGTAYFQSGKISKTGLKDGEHYKLVKVNTNLLSREFPDTLTTYRHICNRECRFKEIEINSLGNEKGICDYPDIYGYGKCILVEIEKRREYIAYKVTSA